MLDFGRNRLVAARGSIIDLDPPRASLVVRWRNDRGCERLTDRLMDIAGDHSEAARLVSTVINSIAPSLPTPIRRVAIAPAMGAHSRAAIVAGMAAANSGVAPVLVDRPVAALAGWLHNRRIVGAAAGSGLALVIDNDGGELSALGADLGRRRLLAVEPLSIGPDDNPADVAERLQDFAARITGAPATWIDVASAVNTIVTSGSGRDHPEFVKLITGLFPATPMSCDLSVAAPGTAIVRGLTKLDALDGFHCAWPTIDIRTDSRLLRAAGPWRPDDLRPIPVRAGNEVFAGRRALTHADSHLRLCVQTDGNVSIEAGGEPRVIEISWPAPGSAKHETSDPEAIDHVEPQLGGHP